MNNEPKKDQKKDPKKAKISIAVYLIVTIAILLVVNYSKDIYYNKEINYNKFLSMIDNKEISEIVISNESLIITPKPGTEYEGKTVYTANIKNDKLIDELIASGEIDFIGKNPKDSIMMNMLISYGIPIALFFVLYKFVFSKMLGKMGGGMGSIGKSNAKIYVEDDIKVTFNDVAGQEEAKESLEEVIDFLNCPAKYTEIGARLPKGVLLVGPPGTGKTLIAKAVAGEAKVPFFSLSGSSFVEMFVGVGASRVRELFKDAEQKAPCIIFIDEIDAIGKSRDSQMQSNDEREQTLNQLLSQMDGFDSSKGIVILAATNRPEILDKALLRPGRFDRRVIVDRPDFKGREAILKVHVKAVSLDDEVDLKEVAKGTPGAVGADLANIVNESALRAVKHGRKKVIQEDLREAVEVIIAGKEKKDRILSPKEKRTVSWYSFCNSKLIPLNI